MDGLMMAADEGSAEVDALEVVFFGLEVGDLADVVTVYTLAEVSKLDSKYSPDSIEKTS